MSKVKFELDAWSDAELDLISARAVAGMLSERLFADGNKADEEVALAITRLIENALTILESGRIR